MLSEEEIIKILKEIIQKNKQIVKEAYKSKDINAMELVADEDREAIAIFKILDLYQEEKEKNKLLIEGKFREVADKNSYIKDNYISKDKIREKIKELEKDIEKFNNDSDFWTDTTIIFQEQIEVLQELLVEE